MYTTHLLLIPLAALVIQATPFIKPERCNTAKDCLHGFPVTVVTLAYSRASICVAKNPRKCVRPTDCDDALTTCVSNRCSHGVRGAPCSTRADCSIGHYCALSGICEHGISGAKCNRTTSVQCVNGLTCTSEGTCSPGVYNARCALDRNCGTGLYCAVGRCRNGKKRRLPVFFLSGTPSPPHQAPSFSVQKRLHEYT